MTVNKDRVELFAAALESDRYHQCKGQLKMNHGYYDPSTGGLRDAHCALGVATQVALDNGLRAELELYDTEEGFVWGRGVLHYLVSDWYGWNGENDEYYSDNPSIPLTSPDGLRHEIASANDAGYSFWDIAQAVRAKYLKDEG